MQILLVDDDTENALALSEILKGAGHSVITACDGYDALEVINRNALDAVVTDGLMPRMDGFVLCRTIRSKEEYKDLPVIIFTGEYTDDSDVKFARDAGATTVLKKSADLDKLLATLAIISKSQEDLPGVDTPSDGRIRSNPVPEDTFLKEYNVTLVRRLGAKMAELEAVNRKLVERNVQLEHEKKKYRQLFTSANDGIMLISQYDGTVIESNSHARQILKLNEKELSLRKLQTLAPFGSLLLDKMAHGERVQFESSYESGATRIFLDISGAPIGTEDNLYLIIFRNVTRRKEWLEKFIVLDKLRALGRLSHGLVHEIGNPLNVISVNLQLLDRALGEPSPDKKFTKSALEAVKVVEKVLRETMNFAQPQMPSKSKLQLGLLLAEIAGLARTSLQKYKIALDIQQDSPNCIVLADKSQLLHAFLNIVQNSIEAMPDGGKLVLRLDDAGGRRGITLKFVDTGIGMDEDSLKLAMEPFYTTKRGALGMGLSISNRLLELNDGVVSLESKPGTGTTITIHFRSLMEPAEESSGLSGVSREEPAKEK